MKTRHIDNETLSAYLDGHARRPERVAQHLESCPACARRHAELKAMGDALRELPEPETQPYFVAKVKARIQEKRHRIGERISIIQALTAFATVAILVAATVMIWPNQRNRAVDRVHAPDIAYDVRWQRDEEVVAALAVLMEEGGEVGLFEAGMVAEESDYEEVSAQTLLTSLLETLDEADDPASWETEGPVAPEEMNPALMHDVNKWMTLTGEED